MHLGAFYPMSRNHNGFGFTVWCLVFVSHFDVCCEESLIFSVMFGRKKIKSSWNFAIILSKLFLVNLQSLHKILYLHLISWCGNLAERHSFRIVSGDSPETMRKLCLFTKFPYHEIRWNCGILPRELHWKTLILYCMKIKRFGIFFKYYNIFFSPKIPQCSEKILQDSHVRSY